MEFMLDPTGETTLEAILNGDADEFEALEKSIPDFGYTNSTIWLRFTVRNKTEAIRSWRLYFHENFKQRFYVYSVEGNAPPKTLLALDETTPFSGRPIDFPEMIAPLELGPQETKTIYVKYWSGGSTNLSTSVLPTDDFATLSANKMAKNFMFFGMTMLLIVIALIAMLIFRHIVFAAYAGYALSTLLFIMHSDGVTFQYLWPNAPVFNGYASILTGSGIAIFGALFARIFLKTKRFHPIIDKLLIATITITLLIIVASWFFDNRQIKKLLVLVTFLSIALFAVAGLVAARTRFKQVRFYILAWAIAVGSATLMFLRHWFGVEISREFQYDTMRFVMVFDAAMMGLAIVDQYHQLRTSRQRALSSSLDEARRNLDMNKRLHSLEKRYQLASQLAESKDELIKNTVHDLRTPLHALQLNVKNMIEGADADPKNRATIDATFNYLEELVATQLQNSDVTDSSSGILQSDVGESLSADTVLNSIYEMFAPDAAKAKLNFVNRVAPLPQSVEPLVLMRIVSNLVSNAIKYTRRGEVCLEANEVEKGILVAVSNSGPAMSSDEFTNATGREVRLENDVKSAEGHGLGLAIVRELVDLHGWGLSLNDKATDQTRIELLIPVKAGEAR